MFGCCSPVSGMSANAQVLNCPHSVTLGIIFIDNNQTVTGWGQCCTQAIATFPKHVDATFLADSFFLMGMLLYLSPESTTVVMPDMLKKPSLGFNQHQLRP